MPRLAASPVSGPTYAREYAFAPVLPPLPLLAVESSSSPPHAAATRLTANSRATRRQRFRRVKGPFSLVGSWDAPRKHPAPRRRLRTGNQAVHDFVGAATWKRARRV